MIIASTRKSIWATPSMSASTGRPALGQEFSEKPKSSESSSTGSTSPFSKAPIIVSGITLNPNATSPPACACFAYCARMLESR